MQDAQGMKTVFLFLGSRIYISDALHTPYIEELARNHRVIVFLPKARGGSSEIDTSGYYTHLNVSYHALPEPQGKFWTLFNVLLRNEFIRRYEDDYSIKWRDVHKRRADWRRVVLHILARCFPKNFFSTDFFSRLESWFMPDFDSFRKYADYYKPHVVLVSTPGLILFDAYAVGCAGKAGIPTVAFNFSWDNLTSIPRHVRRTDHLICWNDFLKEKAIELHDYTKDRIFVGGVIRFDHYLRPLTGEQERADFLSSRGLDPSRKTLLYAARSHGTYFKEFIRTLVRWQKENAFVEPVNIFIRVHPLDAPDDYMVFKDIPHVYVGLSGSEQTNAVGGRRRIETTEADWVVKKDTIRHSDVCLNLVSTFTLEAFIFDKPVVNFGFVERFSDIQKFPHYTPIIKAGASRLAETVDDVLIHVNEYLKNPSRDRDARKRMVKRFVSPTDGYSYKRNIEFLDEILKRE